MPAPRRIAAAMLRAVGAWSRGPTGRLVLPGLLLFTLVAVTGVSGAVLVPVAAGLPAPSTTATSEGTDPDIAVTAAPGLPIDPSLTADPALPPTGVVTPRPSTALARWAEQTGNRLGVPPVAMQAYGYAELVLAQTTPGCRLSWTTLAAIGKIESNHGRAGGSTLTPQGHAEPAIIGLPLDGKGGRQRIADTDGGLLDDDRVYDRAVGPMQFIPSTWRENGVDADNDGIKNPNNIDDAAVAAGNYLCKGGRDLSTAKDWWQAILSYNNVRSYAQAVFDAANEYGLASRT